MNEAQKVSGYWVLPTLESNTDGVARLHVSLRAGDQELPVAEAPPDGAYYHLETIAVTAVADFAFANPDGLVPDTITVTLGDESATWPAELRDDPGSPSIV